MFFEALKLRRVPNLEPPTGTKLMVFLAGPPNRGRGAVLKITEVTGDTQEESTALLDFEANLSPGVGMNGHAHAHQRPRTEIEVSNLVLLYGCLATQARMTTE